MNFVRLVAILSSFILVNCDTGPSHDKAIVCSFWAESEHVNNGSMFEVQDLDPNLCTHLIVLDTSYRHREIPWDTSILSRRRDYGKVMKLRRNYPHLQISLAVAHDMSQFRAIAMNAKKRRRFITKAVQMILRYEFDGLHMDWFDDGPQIKHTQRNHTLCELLFVKAIKEAFERNNLILSSSFTGENESAVGEHDFLSLSAFLDFIHFQKPNQVTSAIAMGVPPSKIVINVAFFGGHKSSYEKDGIDEDVDDINYANFDKMFAYNEICQLLGSKEESRWEKTYYPQSGVVTATNLYSKNNRYFFLIFENSRSIANKMRFAVKQHLAGAMAMNVDFDDYVGECDKDLEIFTDYKSTGGVVFDFPNRTRSTFPLLRTINEAIAVALDEVKQRGSDSEEDENYDLKNLQS